jgi:pimeloyl-ACP methyl ester carboxylesterase
VQKAKVIAAEHNNALQMKCSSPGEKLAYEGMEVVALSPPGPLAPPSSIKLDTTPPNEQQQHKTTSKACDCSPRTRIAISESLQQIEIITPPRRPPVVYDGRKKATSNGGGAVSPQQQRQQRLDRPLTKTNNSTYAATAKKASTEKTIDRKKIQAKPTYLQLAKLGYQELVHAIIRPPRSQYPLEALGSDRFLFCGQKFERKDFGVVNERGMLIECSMWQRVQGEEEKEQQTCNFISREEHCDVPDSGEEEESLQLQESFPSRGKIQFFPEINSSNSISNSFNDSDSVHSVEKGQLVYLTIPDSSSTVDTVSSTPSKKIVDDKPPRSSIFSPKAKKSSSTTTHRPSLERQPVVIYLHGNSSSRTEVIPQLGHFLALGLTVVAFDFCGSGRSDGDFVSLGFYEREDLQMVINHLRASGTVSTIALWGRSMGAATALMYGSRDPTISCMILDSPFIDLATLATELVERGKEHGVHVPHIVVSMVMRMLKSSIKQEAGFNIKHISPVSHAPKCFIPAMIVAGEHDDFIKKRHAEVIFEKYAGDKNIVIVDGDHNSPRPRYMVQGAMLFLQSCMKVRASLELVVPLGTSLMAPPWLAPENLKALSSSLTERKRGSGSGRLWLPIDDSRHSSRDMKNRHQQPLVHPSLNDEGPSGSCTSASRKNGRQQSNAASYDLPDMSKRQQQIQTSLFKMLGRDEE